MQISHKFVIIGALSLGSTALLAAGNVWSINKVTDRLRVTNEEISILRNHMMSDMAHDAVRADTMATQLATTDAERLKIAGELAEDAKNLIGGLAENRNKPLPPDVTAAIIALDQPVASYIAQAKVLVTKQGDLTAEREKFDATFQDLADKMEKVGDQIEATLASNSASTEALASQVVKWALAIAGLSILGLGITMALILRKLVSGLSHVEKAMTQLASGQISVDLPPESNDELGRMVKAVKVFRENAERNQTLEREQRRIASQQEERVRKVAELCATFDRMIGGEIAGLIGAAQEFQATADTLARTATATREQAVTVSSAAHEASSNVETVAASAEQLSASIAEIGRRVSEASGISRAAVREASQTDQTMAELADAAQRIGAVVQLINQIASQTNLLALNATIEAARAGDAGKGFAVVASEVKNLAGQTAKATDEIAGQVESIQRVTETAIKAIRSINQTIERIDGISTAIAGAVEEQNAATGEIARAVQQASVGTRQVTSIISEVGGSASRTGDVSAAVLAVADKVNARSGVIKTEVGSFLELMRTA